MSKRMLIEATQNEEVRVAVVDSNRLEEYEAETSTKKQIKGNIYLAKVIRIEPSLQAAFVDYGNERHGFLPFNEIHPDYYRIPISDRKKLEEAFKASRAAKEMLEDAVVDIDEDILETAEAVEKTASKEQDADKEEKPKPRRRRKAASTSKAKTDAETETQEEKENDRDAKTDVVLEADTSPTKSEKVDSKEKDEPKEESAEGKKSKSSTKEETVPSPSSLYNQYKIQEVIKRRQILLVQVVKEERGNKGAALTTYLSLPGRYCVLMPNAGHRSGGISRKISDIKDRKRLRKVLQDLEVQEEMGLIVRTAGAERNKTEIKRDYDYLTRLWGEIREKTLKSIAPELIYAEGDVIKRSIRDIYDKDVEEVLVEGDDAYKTAKDFMKALIPSHAKKVKHYKGEDASLFHKYKVGQQIDEMMVPTAPLPSGGSIVLNTTEALVAIDVNSGKATRERHIDDTAYKTNLEAAAEIARQIRLRDLAGIIVVDFIDMSDSKHIHAVERKFKEAIKRDRARIQVGRISQFGLLEFSRQRLRPSILETNSVTCKHCQGTGIVRSTESVALMILRAIEDEAAHGKKDVITVEVPPEIDIYILNNKRQMLQTIESSHKVAVRILRNDDLIAPDFISDFHERPKPQKKSSNRPQKRNDTSARTSEEGPSSEKDGSPNRRRRGGRSHLRRDRNRRYDKPQEQEGNKPPAEGPVEQRAETTEDSGEHGNRPHNQRRRRRGRGRGRGPRDNRSNPNNPDNKEAGSNPNADNSQTGSQTSGDKKSSRKGWWQRLLDS